MPRPKRRALVEHLLSIGDAVIVGKFNEEIDDRATERELRSWSFTIERAAERAHRKEPRINYRAFRVGR